MTPRSIPTAHPDQVPPTPSLATAAASPQRAMAAGAATAPDSIAIGGTNTVRRFPRPAIPHDLRIAPKLPPEPKHPPIAPLSALLINPFYPRDAHGSFGKHVLTPSLALTSIAAATPPRWTVRLWDENLLQGPPPADPFPAVVGITVHLTFARRAYELADWYRARGATVILGGLHVGSCPNEAAPHADALAIGEGTQIWPKILADVEAGQLRPRYRGDWGHCIDTEPVARRDLLPPGAFLTTSSIIATRGCHNRCGFCYLSTSGVRQPRQSRDVQQVVDEIRREGQPYTVFIDNNLGADREYLRRLCRALRPLEIIWSAAVSLDMTDEPGLVDEMALAGCTGVFVGLETLTDQNLSDAHKQTPRVADYARRVKLFHDNGIQVTGSFVLGFDHDRPDCFARTAQWIEDNRVECATFHILTPYPGTPLFRAMESAGRLLHRDWSLYDTSHVVFRPMHMTPQELLDGYAWCYRTVFSHRSIWRRRPAGFAPALSYLAMSYLYKRCNSLWRILIHHNLAAAAWRPLVALNRWRHLAYRRRRCKQCASAILPEPRHEPAAGDPGLHFA